ncbi:uncharacterized protein K460DRAFT_358738 [Cucurbitaria berberidis CBS 394.84]|uniref:Uncharacterized protein n=1 Tax=Cucurbitaria berberidis CBS 394.84 TaxID=1168544 RepID=A0A9P4GAW0_9PLEO|nr:uncharacterized protein K460DRAFT_358738 [Cucurbitaria berberidis CBS 394.84]KAF1842067.1 hypothetical protein K460DRAFT_358738 [Cucurbitaria berberidis CBS 394.84]
MDRYPEVKVSERECPREDWTSSRHDSGNSVNKAEMQHSSAHDTDAHKQEASTLQQQYTSFAPPSNNSQQQSDDSMASTSSSSNEINSTAIDAEYARYTDAPPPYSEKQYEGKSEQETSDMRMSDYAKEISRMMGRQLVKDLKTGTSDKPEESQ